MPDEILKRGHVLEAKILEHCDRGLLQWRSESVVKAPQPDANSGTEHDFLRGGIPAQCSVPQKISEPEKRLATQSEPSIGESLPSSLADGLSAMYCSSSSSSATSVGAPVSAPQPALTTIANAKSDNRIQDFDILKNFLKRVGVYERSFPSTRLERRKHCRNREQLRTPRRLSLARVPRLPHKPNGLFDPAGKRLPSLLTWALA